MNLEETKRWLRGRSHLIPTWMDYNPATRHQDVDLDMRAWLNNPRWDDGVFALEPLGFSGTGGRFLALARPGGEYAVAFMGSEGSRGVLVPNLKRWVQAIAHAPTVLEASHETRRAYVTVISQEEESAALCAYRQEVEALHGPLPPLSELCAGVQELDASYRAWVASRLQTFSMADLQRAGLQGGEGGSTKRRAVCARLGYRALNAKSLKKSMNADGVSLAEFQDAVRYVESASSRSDTNDRDATSSDPP